jgi:hypothetical protein
MGIHSSFLKYFRIREPLLPSVCIFIFQITGSSGFKKPLKDPLCFQERINGSLDVDIYIILIFKKINFGYLNFLKIMDMEFYIVHHLIWM